MAVTVTSGDTINVTITQPASSSTTITSKGPKGDTGETGAAGAAGATGATGAAGAAGKTYSVSCVDGDNSDEEKIRLTDSDGGTDDVVIEAGTGMSIARSSDKITLTNTVTGGSIMTLVGAASVDTQTGERFISMSYSTADFSGNIAPMKTPIPLACTLGTLCVSIGGASTDAVIKIYKNDSALFTSDSTTWSSAHDRQVFTINSGTYAAGDTLSFSVDQSTTVDMNYVIGTLTLNVS